MSFISIRKAAQTGIMSEWRLRTLQREGKLPGVVVGQTFLVDTEQLSDLLHVASKPAVAIIKGGERHDG